MNPNEMTGAEIKTAIGGMVSAMVEKGIKTPAAQLEFDSNGSTYVWLRGEGVNVKSPDANYLLLHEDDLKTGVIAAAWDTIAALPTTEERDTALFRRKLADLIDLGNAKGIDVDFVNPLTAMMKKLSENAITHKREVTK